MKNKILPFNIALIALWVLFQVFLLLQLGLHTDLEAAKYTYQANNLLTTGGFTAPKYLFYTTLIFIIALFVKLGVGYWFVVIFQMLINGLATIIFYKLSKSLTGNQRIAQVATLLFLTFYPLQLWNVYMYTESLFISFTILFTYIVYKYPPLSFRNFLINILPIVLLILTRPAGLLFIVPFLLYSFIISKGSFRKFLIIALALGLFSTFILINFAFKGGEDMDAMKPFKEEHVICFIPSANPKPVNVANTNYPVYDIFYYILHNPLHFSKLLGKRLASFFNLTRPFYSPFHNLYLILLIIPVYTFAFFGLYKMKKKFNDNVIRFILLILLFYTLGTTFQCDDYHSRFIMPLFAFIFLLSATGFIHVFNQLFNKNNTSLLSHDV